MCEMCFSTGLTAVLCMHVRLICGAYLLVNDVVGVYLIAWRDVMPFMHAMRTCYLCSKRHGVASNAVCGLCSRRRLPLQTCQLQACLEMAACKSLS